MGRKNREKSYQQVVYSSEVLTNLCLSYFSETESCTLLFLSKNLRVAISIFLICPKIFFFSICSIYWTNLFRTFGPHYMSVLLTQFKIIWCLKSIRRNRNLKNTQIVFILHFVSIMNDNKLLLDKLKSFENYFRICAKVSVCSTSSLFLVLYS